MPTRGNPENKCENCRMWEPICICREIPRIELATKIVVIMHVRERWLTTNTATLALMALPNGELHYRGGRERAPEAETLFAPGTSAGLLFPTEDAIELTPENVVRIPRPLTLIVPDGSWRQARKVVTREPSLAALPRYTLPPGPPSDYRLRNSPHERNLCTFEAIARALGVLEGPEVQARLERLLLTKVERMLWSRGKLPPEKCETRIPDEAILASHIAGARGAPRKTQREFE